MDRASETAPGGAVRSTCPYCGVGCGVRIDREADGRFRVTGDTAHPANFGRLCSKGTALAETLNATDGRLREARIGPRRVSAEAAVAEVAQRFARTIAEHGPDSVAFYVSGQLLTEDYYVANKLMKGFIGSANIDTNSRLCMSSAVAGHKRAFGADIVPVSYDDLEQADLVVLVGSNLAWCHPVLFQRIMAVRKRRPLRLVCIDPRRTATAEQCDVHLPIRAGADVALFNGLLVQLAERGLVDAAYVADHTVGADAALAAARADVPDLAAMADRTGLDAAALQGFVDEFVATSRVVTVFSQGVNQSSQGTDKVNSILNCHLFSGRIGKPGAGPLSITGQPNAMGGREVGGLANMLAAHMDFDPASCDRVQRFWGSPTIATAPGRKAVDLFRAVEAGEIKAVWIMATNPVASLPDADQVRRALEACPFVVVSECYERTDTLPYADVVLPATTWGERDGTVTNSERCISRQHPARQPGDGLRHDWQWICAVAKAMGHGAAFDFRSSADVFAEHVALTAFENDGARDFDLSGWAGIDRDAYDRLSPTRWPVRAGGAVPLLSDGRYYTPDRRARFVAVQHQPPRHVPDALFPLVLNTGRLRDQWHTMTRTGRSERLMQHQPDPVVSVHPDDAASYGLADGGFAQVRSQWGEALCKVEVTDSQQPGTVFMSIHWTDCTSGAAKVARLVNPATDPVSGQPESKHTPVSVASWQPGWHVLVVADTPLTPPMAAHWTVNPTGQLWLVEAAGTGSPVGLLNWAEGVVGDDEDVMRVEDSRRGRVRMARVDADGRLVCAMFVSTDPAGLPVRGQLGRQAAQPLSDPMARIELLAGKPAAAGCDTGRTVCACFNVGINTIREAIVKHQLHDAAGIGRLLRAGTNCGSCVPELNRLVSEAREAA